MLGAKTPMRITIRFGEKDADLMLMASQYHLGDMLRLAIRHYLGQTFETIPLPPGIDVKPLICSTIYLRAEDSDSISFMSQFPAGYRSTAAKLLIRHATAQCNIRHLLCASPKSGSTKDENTPDGTFIPARHTAVKPESSAQSKVAPPKTDSIFDLI